MHPRDLNSTSVTAVRRLGAAPLPLALVVCMAGCVTERVGSWQGVPVKPASAVKDTPQPKASDPAAKVPQGPISVPVAGTSLATDVQVEVLPIGRFSYDGQALPLVSPDGRFAAFQEGSAPTWSTILAESGAEEPLATRLAVFEIATKPSRKIDGKLLPLGCLLGRSADSEGFLVEKPRADGSRWIGKVSWLAGTVRWLVQDDKVNAHAMLTPAGDLVYTRRERSGGLTFLVLHPPSGRDSVKDPVDGGFAYPMPVESDELCYVFRYSRSGLDLDAVRIDRHESDSPRIADTRQTWRIMGNYDPLVPHQMASTAPPCWPRSMSDTPASQRKDDQVLTVFDPRRNRMCRFNWMNGAIEPLADKSIGAAPTGRQESPGYFCTAPQGLVFLATPSAGWPTAWSGDAPVAKVMPQPYVPLPLATQPRSYLLVGPVRNAQDQLELTKMAVAGAR